MSRMRYCVCITGPTVDDARRQMESVMADPDARGDGVLMELRADRITDITPELVTELVNLAQECIIFTLRSSEEGGNCSLPNDERIALYQAAADAAYWDIDESSGLWDALAIKKGSVAGAGGSNSQSGQHIPQRILSRHDIQGTETVGNILSWYIKAFSHGADIAKYAGMAVDDADGFTVLHALDQWRSHAQVIGIAMGGLGRHTRILGPLLGSAIAYCAGGWDDAQEQEGTQRTAEAGTLAAPGQYTLHELRDVFCLSSHSTRTRVYGIVGNPVAHSLSPLLHNRIFRHFGIDAIYVHFAVQDFMTFIREARRMPLRLGGLSVTAPCKHDAYHACQLLDDASETAEAVNTIIAEASISTRILSGFNTDGQAVAEVLESHLREGIDEHFLEQLEDVLRETEVAQVKPVAECPRPMQQTDAETPEAASLDRGAWVDETQQQSRREEVQDPTEPSPIQSPAGAQGVLHDKKVLILGAGGAARAIAHSLRQRGCALTISNRTLTHAEQLARTVGGLAVRLPPPSVASYDIIINTTTVGMAPDMQVMPLPLALVRQIRKDALLMDIIYAPLRTRLITEAPCRTINGLAMFRAQAALQAQHWTGRPADICVSIIEETLREERERTGQEQQEPADSTDGNGHPGSILDAVASETQSVEDALPGTSPDWSDGSDDPDEVDDPPDAQSSMGDGQ